MHLRSLEDCGYDPPRGLRLLASLRAAHTLCGACGMSVGMLSLRELQLRHQLCGRPKQHLDTVRAQTVSLQRARGRAMWFIMCIMNQALKWVFEASRGGQAGGRTAERNAALRQLGRSRRGAWRQRSCQAQPLTHRPPALRAACGRSSKAGAVFVGRLSRPSPGRALQLCLCSHAACEHHLPNIRRPLFGFSFY